MPWEIYASETMDVSGLPCYNYTTSVPRLLQCSGVRSKPMVKTATYAKPAKHLVFVTETNIPNISIHFLTLICPKPQPPYQRALKEPGKNMKEPILFAGPPISATKISAFSCSLPAEISGFRIIHCRGWASTTQYPPDHWKIGSDTYIFSKVIAVQVTQVQVLCDNIMDGIFLKDLNINSKSTNHHAMPASKKKMPGKFMKISSSADLQPAWRLTGVMMRHAVWGVRNLLQRAAKYRKNKGSTTRIVRP